MRKNVLASYFEGVMNTTVGESYATILRYFLPEFITSLLLYSGLSLLDARFIADLKSTSTYATLGVSLTFLHFITKIAEAFGLSITVLCGQYNGAGRTNDVGRAFVEAFWVIMLIGACVSGILFFGASAICSLLGLSEKMFFLGVPFLRLRAIGIFLTFGYFACVSLMRGLKNTQTPMYVFVFGGVLFLLFDYALIFGKWGFPQLGLMGSAWASVIQYGAMTVLALAYILLSAYRTRYHIVLFSVFERWSHVRRILSLSWPMVLDKATMAAAYIWLGIMIAPMGKYALASYTVIKDLERFTFIPAVAFAQIITFLVSNDFGKQNWHGIAANIKKVVFMASLMVCVLLLFFSFRPDVFVSCFDQKGTFTAFSCKVIPLLSIFVFFDLLQLILSAALRGAGDVHLVMWTRFLVLVGFFCPFSYACSLWLPLSDPVLKFVVIYSVFYVSSGIMSIVYIRRFRTGIWAQRASKSEVS